MRSMTGFGQGKASHVSVEVFSVNRKGLEISFTLPRALRRLEGPLRTQVCDCFQNGSVQVKVYAQSPLRLTANLAVAKQLHEQWQAIANHLHLKQEIPLSLLNVPDLFTEEVDEEELNRLVPQVQKALKEAIDHCNTMRETEGAALKRDLSARLELLKASCAEIKKVAAGEPTRQFERFKKLMLNLKTPLDEDRIAKEAAFAADRVDIAEEITRLESHFTQFEAVLKKPSGRTLDFLLMEMQREVTTIGGKSGLMHTLEMKSEITRMREQVANVE